MSNWSMIREMPPLSERERMVLSEAATEEPFFGKYVDFWEKGVYLCRQCGNTLYRSEAKFKCECGWPSFDAEIPDAVAQRADSDGTRTEIVCANCLGHLGHVFGGEGLTTANVRHCVNSLSLTFRASERALFAGGCFWGVEDFFSARKDVFAAISGYTGGFTENPDYRMVCGGGTGHAEAVLIEYDPELVSYRDLARFFFEIHDPTQLGYQGPDIGAQYRSAVFYFGEDQEKTIRAIIEFLRSHGLNVVTEVVPAGKFYQAEDYHQHYFTKNPSRRQFTCHNRREIDWA